MNNILKKTLTLGVVASSVVAVSLIDTDKANALTLNLEINGANFAGGGALSGTFSYDTVSNTYSNFNITSSSTTISNNGGTNPFNYTDSNLTQYSSFFSDNFTLDAEDGSTTNPDAYRFLRLQFANSWNTFNTVGQTNSIVPSSGRDITSLETYNNGQSPAQIFSPSLQGGTVVVKSIEAVPEPLTILGTLLAGGIGVAIKKKRGVSSSESC